MGGGWVGVELGGRGGRGHDKFSWNVVQDPQDFFFGKKEKGTFSFCLYDNISLFRMKSEQIPGAPIKKPDYCGLVSLVMALALSVENRERRTTRGAKSIFTMEAAKANWPPAS